MSRMLRLSSLSELNNKSQSASRRISAFQVFGRKPTQGEMNKTEKKYAAHLDFLKQNGEILDYWFESLKLKIADQKCWYSPDFLVLKSDNSLELHEVKGAPEIFRDDAKVKVKVCASTYPIPIFVVYPDKTCGWRKEQYSS